MFRAFTPGSNWIEYSAGCGQMGGAGFLNMFCENEFLETDEKFW
jgi:hypothetical protein